MTSQGVTQATALNIRSYGVSMTTLEEVFLKIGEVFLNIGARFMIYKIFLKRSEDSFKLSKVVINIGWTCTCTCVYMCSMYAHARVGLIRRWRYLLWKRWLSMLLKCMCDCVADVTITGVEETETGKT